MHSPIIYIIKNSQNGKNFKGHLDEDLIPDYETIQACIPESDWFEPNTLSNHSWHRGNWSDHYIEMLNPSSNFYTAKETNNYIQLIITKNNIWNWYLRVAELEELHSKALKEHFENDELFVFSPIQDLGTKIEYDDMVGKPHGGLRFALFERSYDNEDELEFYGILSEKSLIDYAKDQVKANKSNEISFDVCTNVAGDYHF